jgi:serine protease Do
VEDGSPADKAGLKAGDVLLGVQGKTIERSSEVPLVVAGVKPGSKVTFDVWRDGKKQTVEVTVGAVKDEQVAAATQDEAGSAETGKLGLAVRQSEDGLVVENASGPAARAGIRAGDVVTAVNGRPVKIVGELKAAAAKAKGAVALLVRRGDDSMFVPVEIS